MTKTDVNYLWKRQQAYDRLAKKVWPVGEDRASSAALDIHNKIMVELDALPISEGGRQDG